MKIEFIFVAGFLAFGLIAAFSDLETDQKTQDLYCEMVEIHKDTGGEYGWPDYNQNYDEVCK